MKRTKVLAKLARRQKAYDESGQAGKYAGGYKRPGSQNERKN